MSGALRHQETENKRHISDSRADKRGFEGRKLPKPTGGRKFEPYLRIGLKGKKQTSGGASCWTGEEKSKITGGRAVPGGGKGRRGMKAGKSDLRRGMRGGKRDKKR